MKHPKQERTLVIIKPDGVQRMLIGEIIERYERTGLKLLVLKFLIPTPEQAKKHYLVDPGWLEVVGSKALNSYQERGLKSPFKSAKECGQAVLERNANYISAGPVVVMVWQGNKAIGVVRKITGGTEPLTSDVGTIRGDFTSDSYDVADLDSRSIRNLIHASGSPEEAEKEIKVWFNESEIVNYTHLNERILYDVDLNGIKE